LEVVEAALDMGESLRLPEVIAEALNSKGMLLWHRPHESGALLQEAVRIARAHDLATPTLRAQFNLSGLMIEHDRLLEALEVLEEAVASATMRGDRTWERHHRGQLAEVLVLLGDWDRAWAVIKDLLDHEVLGLGGSLLLSPAISILTGRGRLDEAAEMMLREERLRGSTDLQTRGIFDLCSAQLTSAQGRPAEALAYAERAVESWEQLRQPHYLIEAHVEAVTAALAADDVARAEELLAMVEEQPSIWRRSLTDAQEHRMRAWLMERRGEDASAEYAEAAAIFRRIGMRFFLAVTLVESGEGLDEARGIFEKLGAEPWLERLAALPV
jgi:tetratricopeptide (TPR) repeat protein